MIRKSIIIGGVEIRPGERKTFDIAVARLYTHTDMTIPITVIHGVEEGPTLFICAAIHGDEIQGVEIIRRLLKLENLKNIKGTLIAIPVVNVFGFINQTRYSPDRRDLNRFFPGTDSGSLTSQLAKLFMEEIIEKCTHGIDLHTGSNHRTNLPQIRAYLDDPETEKLAKAFGAPVILDANLLGGSLRQAVKDIGIPVLLYEAGEVLRFDEVSIQAGINGILAVMSEIKMMQLDQHTESTITPLIAHSSTWVRAPISGILRNKIELGQSVSENEILGVVSDPFGDDEENVIAGASGIIIGQLKLPLVYKGDAVFHIAKFDSKSAAKNTIEAFRQEFEPET
ncbi:MAG: succinylglutamate desuccinylase/aspartoacylase family protein [Melioribacteraceae bacterium]|nr:succinylglutamate desuccinylase/aspartoacylase family protein [Melioribacteraceae bacterium]MCF8263541.1 succinylglutamate desuccinylase/aspartoacylase family protein [Melioribacteraceae bacterium]MCF8413513.1 succinylglutamate desuccinylase/aspartoacylase family protein [Melioribacteraceae bacterium]MCF8430667.1 succinylglutamate desuccinylase/aspartoacylase family protein [Melioribacteraceae bacterium]